MTLLKTASITKWVKQTRSLPFFSVFSGFLPDDTPGVGTYYDFLKRIINGPYQKPCSHWVRPTRYLTGLHPRNLGSEKSARKDKADPCHSQSQLLVNELLAHSEQPRTTGLAKLLEDLLIRVAILPAIPSLHAGSNQSVPVSLPIFPRLNLPPVFQMHQMRKSFIKGHPPLKGIKIITEDLK